MSDSENESKQGHEKPDAVLSNAEKMRRAMAQERERSYNRSQTTQETVSSQNKSSHLSSQVGLMLAMLGGLSLMIVGFGVIIFGSNVLGAILSSFGVAIGWVSIKVHDGEQMSAFERACARRGVEYKSDSSLPSAGFLIGASENAGRVVIKYPIPFGEQADLNEPLVKDRLKLLEATKILQVDLSIDDNAVYQAGPVASLAGAVAGGLSFGGAGAIVGSLATSRIGKGKIQSCELKIRMDDIDEPLIRIRFISKPTKASEPGAKARLETAEKWTNLIEVVRHRAANQT